MTNEKESAKISGDMDTECVLFDMDGTLADTSEGIFACFEYAFKKLGAEPPTEEELKECVGPPLLDSFLKFFGGDQARAVAGVNAYRERYAVKGWRECTLYPGLENCLAALQRAGIKAGVATCKPQPFAEMILKDKGIGKYFSIVVGSKLDNSFDDKAEIIALAMKNAGVLPENTVMVGDRAGDMLGALKKGALPVGVGFGFAREGELEAAGAAFVAADYPALENFLLKNAGKKKIT